MENDFREVYEKREKSIKSDVNNIDEVLEERRTAPIEKSYTEKTRTAVLDDIRDMLKNHPEMGNKEIALKVGSTPSQVANMRCWMKKKEKMENLAQSKQARQKVEKAIIEAVESATAKHTQDAEKPEDVSRAQPQSASGAEEAKTDASETILTKVEGIESAKIDNEGTTIEWEDELVKAMKAELTGSANSEEANETATDPIMKALLGHVLEMIGGKKELRRFEVRALKDTLCLSAEYDDGVREGK